MFLIHFQVRRLPFQRVESAAVARHDVADLPRCGVVHLASYLHVLMQVWERQRGGR